MFEDCPTLEMHGLSEAWLSKAGQECTLLSFSQHPLGVIVTYQQRHPKSGIITFKADKLSIVLKSIKQ